MSNPVALRSTTQKQLRLKELSALARDLDRVWLDTQRIPGDGEYLRGLVDLTPESAAGAIAARMQFALDDTVVTQANALGVAVGQLTRNRGIPSGIYGVWRSDLPVILLEQRVSSDPNFCEFWGQIGSLIYGDGRRGDGSSVSMAFADSLAVRLAV
jgi:hypothetical protein